MASTAEVRRPKRVWAHEPLYCLDKGRWKVYCRCGVQSPRLFETMQGAQQAHKDHVGIKEMERKVVLR